MSLFTNLKIIKPVNNFAFLINLVVLALAIGFISMHYNNLPNEIPLWYSLAWGNARLSSPKTIWLIPALIFAFFVFNNIAAKLVDKNHAIVAKILVWGSVFVALIFAFSLYRIVLVVI